MQLLQAQVELAQRQASAPLNPSPASSDKGSNAPKPKKDDDGKGHSYGNRLEQRQHEKVASGGKSFERIQKAQNA